MFFPKTQTTRHIRDAFNANLQGQFIVINVTAFFQGRQQIDFPVPAPFPAMETRLETSK